MYLSPLLAISQLCFAGYLSTNTKAIPQRPRSTQGLFCAFVGKLFASYQTCHNTRDRVLMMMVLMCLRHFGKLFGADVFIGGIYLCGSPFKYLLCL
jgi:hypothetical protein